MNKEFVMRGQTASGLTEVLNFSGNTPGYAYRLVEFSLFPSADIGTNTSELSGTITAGKVFEDPVNPNYNNDGLIGVSMFHQNAGTPAGTTINQVINDTFLITQDLILAVIDTQAGSPMAVNWQCRFLAEKMNTNEEAVTNFKQYTISND